MVSFDERRNLNIELIFIRHGEGEYTLNIPNSLQISDPILTDEEINQAKLLRIQLPLWLNNILIGADKFNRFLTVLMRNHALYLRQKRTGKENLLT